ncbi:MAG: nuclease-like protein [Gammaproteobacteria bacterium]|uniref:thermonuclease family protein n=1 Tax=Thiocapsa sp. UBA6158 TaxID=1947692 RepID=UPI0025F7CB6C|nr:nuclease-like protein [Thiocapsa sp. UBA6158]NCC27692.1 nuclease-like protein [Gammaproteobacteria bacterium]
MSGAALAGVIAALLLGAQAFAAGAREIVGIPIVEDDGSLTIKGQAIELYGIYLPQTERQCRRWERPVRCAPRSTLALDFRVRGFVSCEPRGRSETGRIQAICHVDRTGLNPGEDLAAYLIQRGWALALPGAPFEYHAMERIARTQQLGVWGTAADAIGPR